MRFSSPQSTFEPAWICLLLLCAGCAIETDEPVIEIDPGRLLGLGREPQFPMSGQSAPEEESTSDADVEAAPPLVLKGAAPNPIDSQTRLSFEVPEDGVRVVLAIYGVDGRRVRLLVDDVLEEGGYSAFWYGRNDADRSVPSGVYIVSLHRGRETKQRKVLLVR